MRLTAPIAPAEKKIALKKSSISDTESTIAYINNENSMGIKNQPLSIPRPVRGFLFETMEKDIPTRMRTQLMNKFFGRVDNLEKKLTLCESMEIRMVKITSSSKALVGKPKRKILTRYTGAMNITNEKYFFIISLCCSIFFCYRAKCDDNE